MIFGSENPIVADEKPSFSKCSMSLSLAFYSVSDKFYFPPLCVSDSFDLVESDAHKKHKWKILSIFCSNL